MRFLVFFLLFASVLAEASPVTCTLNPGGLKQDTFDQTFVNSDGSVTILGPYFWFKNQKTPFFAATNNLTSQGWIEDAANLTGVCRFYGFSFYIQDSRRKVAVIAPTDAVRLSQEGAVQSIGQYSNGVSVKGPIDYLLTELTCR